MRFRTPQSRLLLLGLLSLWGAATLAGPVVAEEPDYVADGHFIIVRVAKSNDFLAYSKWTGQWRRHSFPAGLTVTPVLGDNVVVFSANGGPVKELVAVDSEGNWRVQVLPEPVESVQPIVSTNVAAVQCAGQVYGFSGLRGRWDGVESKAVPRLDTDLIHLIEPGKFMAFSAHTGTWAVTSTE